MPNRMANLPAHEIAVAAAKGSLQASLVGATPAQQKTAHIAYYQAVLASGRANGVATGALAALHSLGVDPGGQNGDT